jgi:DNA-directed RNA polymerase subunit L
MKETPPAEGVRQALAILRNLYQNKELYIAMMPPIQIAFDISKDSLRKSLAEIGVTMEGFDHTCNYIGNILLAIFEKNETPYLSRYLSEHNFSQNYPEYETEKERLEADIQAVREALVDQHLLNRYALKTTSKAPSFLGIDWDVKIKVKDAALEEDIRFPYATCKIRFQREFDLSPFVFLGNSAFDNTQLNFSVDEIDYLIRTLTVVKRHLENAEKGG